MRRPVTRAATPLLIAAAAALVLTLGGCAPEPAPTPSVTATATPTPTPTPTSTGESIAPGALPPAVFGGDCDAALTAADIDDVVGIEMTTYEAGTDPSVQNVGGLTCAWTGTDAALGVSILPRMGIGDTQLPAGDVTQFFEDCDPTLFCSWQWSQDELWITGTFQFVPGMTQAKVDAWGQEIGDAIAAHYAAHVHASWVRDKTGWWPPLDCSAVASAVAKELGGSVTGKSATYPDPPAPGVALGDLASNRTWCELTVPGTRTPLIVNLFAGEAWFVREGEGDEKLDTKVAGVTGYRLADFNGSPSNSFSLSDGVNRVRIDAPSDAQGSVIDLARAVARAAASGF